MTATKRAALFAAALICACSDPEPSGQRGRDIGALDARDTEAGDEPSAGDADGSAADAAADDADDDGAAGADLDADDEAGDDEGSGDVASGGDADDDAAGEPLPCSAPPDVFTGVHATDVDGDPLDVGDRVAVEVRVYGDAGATPVGLTLTATNLRVDVATVTVDGSAASGVAVSGSRVDIPLSGTPATVTLEADVMADTELVILFAEVRTDEGRCPIDRSRAGALLQVIGGTSKTPTCVDMRRFRSVQVAPAVALQSTAQYRAANGTRDDLVAQDFIFCPQSPTVVHVAEFCLERAPGQSVALAGSAAVDGVWEVDDFMLFEVFVAGDRVADGFTSQRHPGGDTFWCGETAQNLCREGCTASLVEVATDRALTPVAVTDSLGPAGRQFADGDVDIGSLLPADGSRSDVRITVLDQGVEGTLRPGLYLIAGE